MRPAPLPFRRCDAFSKGGRPHTDQVTAATKSGTPHRRDYVTARFFFLVDNHAVWFPDRDLTADLTLLRRSLRPWFA